MYVATRTVAPQLYPTRRPRALGTLPARRPPRVRPRLPPTIGLRFRALPGLGGARIQDYREPPASDLVARRGYGGKTVYLQRDAAVAYDRMLAAARAAGFAAPLFELVSGHRSVARQQELWAEALRNYGTPAEARKWVAPPGSSAHHSGGAIDVWLGLSNSSGNVAALRATRAWQWLQANAARFGWAPYTREPWHWECDDDCRRRATGASAGGGGGFGLLLGAFLLARAGLGEQQRRAA